MKYTDTSINQLNVGINPGIAIFIMPNVGAEVSFGVAGFTYNWEKQKKVLVKLANEQIAELILKSTCLILILV